MTKGKIVNSMTGCKINGSFCGGDMITGGQINIATGNATVNACQVTNSFKGTTINGNFCGGNMVVSDNVELKNYDYDETFMIDKDKEGEVKKITVKVNSENVGIKTSPDCESYSVSVHGYSVSTEKAEVSITFEDGELSVNVTDAERSTAIDINVVIMVPGTAILDKVNATTETGYIKCEVDEVVANSAKFKTSTGHISLGGTMPAIKIKMKSDVGNICATGNISADTEITAKTGTSPISIGLEDILQISPDIKTATGSQKYVPRLSGRYKLKLTAFSGCGSIFVY